MLDILTSSWLQAGLWVIAACIVLYFERFMKGSTAAWTLISLGVLIYGIRIGYKLFPYYEQTEIARYFIGIIGLVFLFSGILKYSKDTLKMFGGK